VTISQVATKVSGWVSIHADSNGKPGKLLGHTTIKRGRRSKMQITITDLSRLTPTVWAVLRIDLGRIGTFEFPGPDAPVRDSQGNLMQVSFGVTR